jgi:hypothetical protein
VSVAGAGNGRDPILKERLFGLTNEEGNHGEDVKELYYYLDAVPSYAYARMLYKLPQAAYPYQWLIEENARRRGSTAMEFELIDTGLFDDDRYFDVEVEYAKAEADDVLMRITVHNRGPEPAAIHILPQAWFRNIWSWEHGAGRPSLKDEGGGSVLAQHQELGVYSIQFEAPDRLLFCDNESNLARLFGVTGAHGYFKDAFHEYIVQGRTEAVNASGEGTKVGGFYLRTVPSGCHVTVRLRLRAGTQGAGFADFDAVFTQRIAEANAFYAALQKDIADEDMRRVQRQAFAGMLWNKQFYYFNVRQWLDGDPLQPPPPESRKDGRNCDWDHFLAGDIMSMPDKWEYPWFAAWDLAFHCVTLSLIEPDFAKEQLVLLCEVRLMHPNGELPAYEWAFSDVNPPVHAWAAMRVFENDRQQHGGEGDLDFLERVFHKLLLNFTWWVNRKDPQGLNIFEGGFLGLDNIGVFDRSRPLPSGGHIAQSDGTAWMAMFCLNMLRMSMVLSERDPVFEDMAVKFLDHFLHIARAMTDMGQEGIGLWNDEDNFFYDVLSIPSGRKAPLRLRSMVGLIPLFAVGVTEPDLSEKRPGLWRKFELYRLRAGEARLPLVRRQRGGTPPVRTCTGVPHDPALTAHARRRRVLFAVRRAGTVPLLSRSALRLRMQRNALLCEVSAGRIRQQSVRRQLELARTGLDAGQLPADREPAPLPSVLRRRAQDRVPDRIGRHVDPRPDRRRAVSPPDQALSARCRRQTVGLRRLREIPERSAFQGLHPILRVLPRRQRARLRRLAPDRLDRTGGKPDQPGRGGTGDKCGNHAPTHHGTAPARAGSSVAAFISLPIAALFSRTPRSFSAHCARRA